MSDADAKLAAAEEVGRQGAAFWVARDEVGHWEVGHWRDHSDRERVSCWLTGVRPDAVEFEGDVVHHLARHVRAEWANVSRPTVSDHRALFGGIAEQCLALVTALNKTGADSFRLGGHGLRNVTAFNLLTDGERQHVERDLASVGGVEGLQRLLLLPDLDVLLQRLAGEAERLRDAGPLHVQPGRDGAESGYFVRRMAGLMKGRYGVPAPDVVLLAIAEKALGLYMDARAVRQFLRV